MEEEIRYSLLNQHPYSEACPAVYWRRLFPCGLWWEYHKAVPLRLTGDREAWVAWYEKEKLSGRTGQRGPGEEGYLALEEAPYEPVVVLDMPDLEESPGGLCLCDGNHRVAIRHIQGIETIDMYIGRARCVV